MSFVVASLADRIDQALAANAIQEALQLATSAVQQQPQDPALQHRMGLVLLRTGRTHEAFAHFSNAIRLNPLSVDTRVALANAYVLMNDSWSAAAWLSDACRVAPGEPRLWIQLAQLLHANKREAELEPLLRTALAANPRDKLLMEALAEFYLNRKRYADGVEIYRELAALDPGDPKTFLHFGFCLEHTHKLEEAIERYRDALALNPDFMEAHVDLAGVLWRVADFDGAVRHAEAAVALNPAHPYAIRILGTALLHLNRLAESETELRRALALKPDFPIAIVDLALLLLLAGRFEEGWRVYEGRWTDTDRMNRPAFFRPELEWQGPQKQPVAGKRIVIYAEQGLGDVINFIRYAKVLQADGATVYCVIQQELVPLVESIPGLIGMKPNLSVEADYHVALLELPLHYRTDASNVPVREAYLHPPGEKVEAWREKLRPWDGKLKVGIAWAGHHIHANHHNRSMPLSEFRGIVEMPGVQCFSLQKSEGGRYSDVSFDPAQVVDLTGEWADFTDSAAMVANLDIVISIDSAVVHLAAALGKPVWMVLPPNPDWRWMLERDDSPWYPSLRMFRRSHTEEKSTQMARVTRELKAHKAALLARRQLDLA